MKPNKFAKRLSSRQPARWVLVAMAALVAAWLISSITWYKLSLRAVSTSLAQQTITIEPGQSVVEIADTLKAAGLIRNAEAFKLYLTLHGLRPRLQTGAYQLRPNLSVAQIADIITEGRTAHQRLTIPEGFTLKQITDRVASVGLDSKVFAQALTETYAGTQSASRPAGTSLEGYLFPDTYTVTPLTTPEDLIRTMLQHFDSKVSADIVAGWAAQGLNVHQGLTLASMVEREVSSASDRGLVAGVFLNRLKIGQKLQSDVTVLYGAGLLGKGFSTSLNSPYNTYVVPALPVGPICNPSLAAMRAVAHPTPSDYYYFLSAKDGKTYFARTSDEHERNVRTYLHK